MQEREAQCRWLVSELKWRAVSCFESLLTHTESVSSANALDPALYASIGELLLAHTQNCSLALRLDSLSATCARLRQRLWDLQNAVDIRLVPAPFKRASDTTSTVAATTAKAGTATAASADDSKTEYVYGKSGYVEDRRLAPEGADTRMLRYWEKYIIPAVLNFTKGSFKAYEIENFFAQLRQPLKQNNNSGAVAIGLHPSLVLFCVLH